MLSKTVQQKCARQDLNLHVLRHQILSLARLPIPPLALMLGDASICVEMT